MNHFIRGNNIRENKCTVNSFQSAAGQPNCLNCPAGQNCNKAENIFPEQCPINKYCPEGGNAETCEKGSYNTEISHLTNNDECFSCPPGQHCFEGKIQGDCTAGYICYGGSDTSEDLRCFILVNFLKIASFQKITRFNKSLSKLSRKYRC